MLGGQGLVSPDSTPLAALVECKPAALQGGSGMMAQHAMRMTPAQIAVHLICGLKLPPFVPTSDDICERMRGGP